MLVGRKVAFVLAANVAGAVLGYGALLVIGRAFEPEAYGSFVFATSLAGLYGLATTLGLGTAHQRLVARGVAEDRVLGTAARLRLWMMAGGALAAFAALAVLRLAGRPLTDATTPLVLGAALAIQVVAMGRQLLAETWGGRQAVGRIEAGRVLDAAIFLATLANAGLLLRHLAGGWSPVPGVGAWWAGVLGWTGPPTAERVALLLAACTMAAKVLSLLASAVWALRDGMHVGPYDRAVARELWAFGLPLALTAAIGLVVQYTDVVLLGFFWTAREVGLYGTAQKLSVLAGLVATAASGVLLSRFAQLSAAADRPAEDRTFARAEHWVLLVVAPMAAGLAALAPQAIHIAVGDKYLPGADALRLLALAALAAAVQVPLVARLMGHGLTRPVVVAGVVNAVANAVLNLVLIPRSLAGLATAGAALATLASHLLAYVVLRRRGRSAFGMSWLPPAALRILAAAAVAGGLVWQAAVRMPQAMDRVWELGAWATLGLALYLAILTALRGVTRDDLAFLRAAAHPVGLWRELRGKQE